MILALVVLMGLFDASFVSPFCHTGKVRGALLPPYSSQLPHPLLP
jgi:hypothetical protein